MQEVVEGMQTKLKRVKNKPEMKFKKIVLFFLMSLVVNTVFATITVPRFISNGMVLQRNVSIPIWGWADNAEKITVEFKGKKYRTITGADKKWKINIAAQTAGGPYALTIAGSNKIVVENILIGDVWFCSGQSNMEYELYKASEKYPTEISSSANDQIRHFLVKRRIGFNTATNIESDKGWESANPNTVLNFTAVGYFFARNLYDKYKVPIGLINCSYGGTPAEAWLNENELKDFPAYYDPSIKFKDSILVKSISSKDKLLADDWNDKINKSDLGLQQKWQTSTTNYADWQPIQMPNFWQDQGLKGVESGVVWLTKEIYITPSMLGKNALLRLGNIIMKDYTYFNGVLVGTTSNKYAPRKYSIPTNLLKPGINTITLRIVNESGNAGFIKDKPYRIELGDSIIDLKGEWKYKIGTTIASINREDVTRFQDQTASMYHGMLEPLIGYGIKGVIWYQGESNISRAVEYRTIFSRLINSWRKEWNQGDFPFLYVQLANNNPSKPLPANSKLAELQEAQFETLSLPNTGMSVTNDIGEWNDVHPMNKLEVGRRLALVAQKIAYKESTIVSEGPTYQSMKIDGNKIILSFTNIGSGLMVKNSTELNHFAISDNTKKFVWASAKIVGNTVVVWNKDILRPTAVRYAWADNPVGANLYNKEGLPAACFRTEK